MKWIRDYIMLILECFLIFNLHTPSARLDHFLPFYDVLLLILCEAMDW